MSALGIDPTELLKQCLLQLTVWLGRVETKSSKIRLLQVVINAKNIVRENDHQGKTLYVRPVKESFSEVLILKVTE